MVDGKGSTAGFDKVQAAVADGLVGARLRSGKHQNNTASAAIKSDGVMSVGGLLLASDQDR